MLIILSPDGLLQLAVSVGAEQEDEPQCGGGYLWGGEGVPYKVSVLAIELENCRVDQRPIPGVGLGWSFDLNC